MFSILAHTVDASHPAIEQYVPKSFASKINPLNDPGVKMDTSNLTKQQLVALNKILSEIFQQEVRLSTLLTGFGFSEEQIKAIRSKQLDSLISLCHEILKEIMDLGSDSDRLWYIICERFGLSGNDGKTLQEIGITLGISRERVRQLEIKALRKLKNTKRKDYLLSRMKEQVLTWVN